MIHAARALDLHVMLGCMVESQLGVAPAAAIASLADWVDLDGHLLLAGEPYTGLRFEDGRVLPGSEPAESAPDSEFVPDSRAPELEIEPALLPSLVGKNDVPNAIARSSDLESQLRQKAPERDVDFQIQPGLSVTADKEATRLASTRFTARALDDRAPRRPV